MFRYFLPLLLLLSACRSAEKADPSTRLHELFDEMEQFQIRENPFLATRKGLKEYNDKLPKVTAADEQRRAEFLRSLLEKLNEIDRGQLTPSDQISYDIFRFNLEDDIAQAEFESYLIPVNAEGGFYNFIAFAMQRVPLATVEDYDNYLGRLSGFPDYFAEHIALMRTGLERGMTQPKYLMERLLVTIRPYVTDDPAESSFYTPFRAMPASVPAAEQERLRKEALQVIGSAVLPSYTGFLAFMEEEYIPGCRESIGAGELPDGRAYYEQRIRYFTTMDRTPDQVFEQGQAEVARIRAEMEAIIADVGFQGSFSDFLDFLRTDPQFYPKTPEELLHYAAWLSKKIDGKLPQYFNFLPRLTYGVEPVPDDIAPNYTGGRYVGGSPEDHRSGTYWVNTYKLDSRPLYVMPSLTLHEAVPGHHFQDAVAQELEDVPEFRRQTYLSAFGEGWALYCEYLGKEMGMYTTPYEDFGRLTYEMWRACRLVVDVGMHYKGWTRQEAVDFLAGNSALSLHEVNSEIDRYVGWPGQAVSYKTGEIIIRQLRRKAETELGDQFDLRAFHDLVLSNGAVLLSTLEQMVDAWIDGQKG